MTHKQFTATLAAGEVVAVHRRDWPRLGRDFEEREAHATGVAGVLRLGRLDGRLVAVEEADAERLAVRPLSSLRDARDFVAERLAAYDRLWDG